MEAVRCSKLSRARKKADRGSHRNHYSRTAGRARWTRLIPVAIIVYIISFMDRTNIGFAFDGMGKDLHLDSAAKGLAGGIFFIGYLVMQIPGGHLAERWSAKKFVGL